MKILTEEFEAELTVLKSEMDWLRENSVGLIDFCVEYRRWERWVERTNERLDIITKDIDFLFKRIYQIDKMNLENESESKNEN